ncbi:MAG: T9SS C-terminal target domain-containing protein [Ignavibacteriales bacterium]|nr:MAG: T9SS C-terminal target domain-containing protein [Ignavibacteriales bacterium]
MKTFLKLFILFFIVSNMYAQTWTTYDYNNSNYSLTATYCLTVDASNNIWIGTNRSIVKFNQLNTWTVYDASNSGMPNDRVVDIATTGTNSVWVCTYGSGLLNFNGSMWQQYLPSNCGILSNYTYCVGFDTPGNVWMGILSANAQNAGVMKWSGGNNWTPYNNFFDGYNYKNVEAIAKDNAGNIWCGTSIGVFKFDGTNWTPYTKENTSGGLCGNYVRTIAVDASGNIWFGCEDKDPVTGYPIAGGLSKFTGTSWSNYKPSNSNLTTGYISAIAFRNNEVWVGTGFCGEVSDNKGLFKFDGTNWTNYANNTSTFPGACVFDIVVDKNNNLWVAGPNILTKINFTPSGIEDNYKDIIPTQYSLNAYPNPFNPTTKIEFSIPKQGKYTIKIYNTLGQELSMLVDHELVAGVHSVTFDASGFASGIYICKLNGDNVSLSKKIVLTK